MSDNDFAPTRFTVLRVCPIVKAKDRDPTTTEINEVLGAALRQVGSHTTKLSDLQRALDDGYEVFLLEVGANGVPIMSIRLVR